MKLFYTISLPIALALFASMCSAHIEAHEGRIAYHSQCEVSANPVQYEGHSGTVSVRKWWYRDTLTGLDLYTADEAVHEHCDAVKVLISTPAEIAVARRLDSVHQRAAILFLVAISVILFVWGREPVVAERKAEEAAESAREEAREEARIERDTYETRRLAEQERSRRANADRAARKAARRAAHEAR